MKIPLKTPRSNSKRVFMGISVTPELRKKIVAHPEVNWSAVARQAFKKVISQLERKDEND